MWTNETSVKEEGKGSRVGGRRVERGESVKLDETSETARRDRRAERAQRGREI